jgi:hypothetical protein
VKDEKSGPKIEIAIEEASTLKLIKEPASPSPSLSSSLTPEPDDI